MRIPTIWIRQNRTGARRKINQIDWATDLGQSRYAGWTPERELRGDDLPQTATVKTAAGNIKVSEEEKQLMDTGVKETEGYIRRKYRKRKEPDVEVYDKELPE